jgi:hypothetical protein
MDPVYRTSFIFYGIIGAMFHPFSYDKPIDISTYQNRVINSCNKDQCSLIFIDIFYFIKTAKNKTGVNRNSSDIGWNVKRLELICL